MPLATLPYPTSRFSFPNTFFVLACGFVELPTPSLISRSHVISFPFPPLPYGWKVFVVTALSSSAVPKLLQTIHDVVHMSMSYWLRGLYSSAIDPDPRESRPGASRFL